VKFTKMHGLGNDFIIAAGEAARLENPGEIARRLCRRRFGIGADGLVLLRPSKKADIEMQIFNSDGTEAEMCGNALRCAARYLVEKEMAPGPVITIDTAVTQIKARVLPGGRVRVDMGPPILESAKIPVSGPPRKVIGEEIEAGGEIFKYTAVSMGNPHCVIFLEPGQEAAAGTYGPLLERHPFFPRGVNVEFCRINGPGDVSVSVWERGAGETLACGTGACAVTVAGVLLGRLEKKAAVRLPGGTLSIEWIDEGPVFMEGPAEFAYEGEVIEQR
jgi:diaminopimelate epimerase